MHLEISISMHFNHWSPWSHWSLSCFFFSTFWKTDWIHHKSTGIAGAPKVLRSSQPKMSRLWSPTSSTPPQSRGIRWHPVASGHGDVEKCSKNITMLTRSDKATQIIQILPHLAERLGSIEHIELPELSVPTIASYHESVKPWLPTINAQRTTSYIFLQRFLPNFCTTKLLCRPNQ